jgi:hypothetical protein
MPASVAIALQTEPTKRYSQARMSVRAIIQAIAPGSAPWIPGVAQHFLLFAMARNLSSSGIFVNAAYHSK